MALIEIEKFSLTGGTILGDLLVIASTLCYACGILVTDWVFETYS